MRRAGAEHQRALDHILQLSHVARPRVPAKHRHHVVRHGAVAPADPGAVLGQQMLDQGPEVVGALTQRRHPHLDDVDPVQQILAEAPVGRQRHEIAMGRGDDADVGRHRGRSTKRMHFLLLQHAQELSLQGRRHVADFVEEDRPALGRLKQAPLVVMRVGERTAPMAEQLALQECLGDRRTIHGEKWPGRARALLVQRPSQQFLSRPALPHQQDRCIAQCRAIDRAASPPASRETRPGSRSARRPRAGLAVAPQAPADRRLHPRACAEDRETGRGATETPEAARPASGMAPDSLARLGLATNTKGTSPRSAHNTSRPVPSREVRFTSATTTSTSARARISWASVQQDAVRTVYLRPKSLLQLTLHRLVVFDDENGDN